MKLIATMMLSLDGVYQGPGRPDEDRRGGFDRGGWAATRSDPEMWPFLTAMFERADALLLGRKTWEIWAPYWPLHDRGDPVSHGINVLPKYVPSTILTDPTWQNTHVLKGDVEAAVRELKAKPGSELQVHGSGNLLRWLLERDLVDELNLRLFPVVVGDGLRLFPERGQTHDLTLVESRSMPSGVTLLTYRPAGRATYGTAGGGASAESTLPTVNDQGETRRRQSKEELRGNDSRA
jgi:dihydrofolate reductase